MNLKKSKTVFVYTKTFYSFHILIRLLYSIEVCNFKCSQTIFVVVFDLSFLFLSVQTSANQKAQEVTCWLDQAYQELIEGWDSTEGESYAERYQVRPGGRFNKEVQPTLRLNLNSELTYLRWETMSFRLQNS